MKTVYRCEFCGKVHEGPDEATICEASHIANGEVGLLKGDVIGMPELGRWPDKLVLIEGDKGRVYGRTGDYTLTPELAVRCQEHGIKIFDDDDVLRDKLQGGGCTLSGPGRGDCEHAVGLPGESIPGQHDGDDDTVDVYGKPNGWCWSCWKSYQIKEFEEWQKKDGEFYRKEIADLKTKLEQAERGAGMNWKR